MPDPSRATFHTSPTPPLGVSPSAIDGALIDPTPQEFWELPIEAFFVQRIGQEILYWKKVGEDLCTKVTLN